MSVPAAPRPGSTPAATSPGHQDRDTAGGAGASGGGLRERRRRELRQQLSDAATAMFLQHGFEAVRVADVARACGVTQQTVFNHFPTKESLLADRWEPLTAQVAAALAQPGAHPVDAVVEVLRGEVDHLLASAGSSDTRSSLADAARFVDLVRTTPSLQDHERQALHLVTEAAARALAARPVLSEPGARAGAAGGTSGAAGQRTHEPDPGVEARTWMTATALAGLCSVFFRALHQRLTEHADHAVVDRLRQDVLDDLDAAAQVLRSGLPS